MLTLHAAERFMQRVLNSNIDKEYITNNFYHIGMLIKNSYDKAEIIYEGSLSFELESNVKYYLNDNVIFVVDEKGVILTIMTINISDKTKTKYKSTIYELREILSTAQKELNDKKVLISSYEKLSVNGFIQLNPLINIIESEIIELGRKIQALEIMLKIVCKSLFYNKHTCSNRNIVEVYKQDLFKANINTNSIEVKTIENLILSDLYKVQVCYNKY